MAEKKQKAGGGLRGAINTILGHSSRNAEIQAESDKALVDALAGKSDEDDVVKRAEEALVDFGVNEGFSNISGTKPPTTEATTGAGAVDMKQQDNEWLQAYGKGWQMGREGVQSLLGTADARKQAYAAEQWLAKLLALKHIDWRDVNFSKALFDFANVLAYGDGAEVSRKPMKDIRAEQQRLREMALQDEGIGALVRIWEASKQLEPYSTNGDVQRARDVLQAWGVEWYKGIRATRAGGARRVSAGGQKSTVTDFVRGMFQDYAAGVGVDVRQYAQDPGKAAWTQGNNPELVVREIYKQGALSGTEDYEKVLVPWLEYIKAQRGVTNEVPDMSEHGRTVARNWIAYMRMLQGALEGTGSREMWKKANQMEDAIQRLQKWVNETEAHGNGGYTYNEVVQKTQKQLAPTKGQAKGGKQK